MPESATRYLRTPYQLSPAKQVSTWVVGRRKQASQSSQSLSPSPVIGRWASTSFQWLCVKEQFIQLLNKCSDLLFVGKKVRTYVKRTSQSKASRWPTKAALPRTRCHATNPRLGDRLQSAHLGVAPQPCLISRAYFIFCFLLDRTGQIPAFCSF